MKLKVNKSIQEIVDPDLEIRIVKEQKKHYLHTYKRSSQNKRIYKCLHPLCSHYIDKDYLENKLAECPKCHEEFTLTLEKLRCKLPVCLKCSRSPKAKTAGIIEDTMSKILNEVKALKTPEDAINDDENFRDDLL